MNDNKNARPAGGTAGQAAENNAASKSPQDDFSTDSSKKREEKYQLITLMESLCITRVIFHPLWMSKQLKKQAASI